MGRYSKEYYQNNKEKHAKSSLKYYYSHKQENKEKHAKSSLKYYYSHKQAWIKRVREYGKRNPEKVKKWNRKTFKKWYSKKKNKEHMKKLVNEYYHKHKNNFLSRNYTNRIIKGSKNPLCKKIENTPIKECNLCKTKKNLQIHHEIYPTKKDEIIKAIKDGKIYYVCKKCHIKLRKNYNKIYNPPIYKLSNN